MTSHDVVRKVKRLCRTRKVGHAGTLDPLATGVLLVAVGDGTKILQFLLAEDKSYLATFRLGITTDTLDIEGQVEQERPIADFTRDDLELVCDKFRGEFEQLPPMYSALKKDGVPLYKLARQGITVERKLRKVNVSRLELIGHDNEYVTIEVDCSKGTYIRSLVSDIGEEMGCGAHLTSLRRLKSGAFSVEECLPLGKLHQHEESTPKLLTLDDALNCYPSAQLNEVSADALTFGIPPQLDQVCLSKDISAEDLVRLQIDNKLAAVARYMPLRLKEKRSDFELIRVFVSR